MQEALGPTVWDDKREVHTFRAVTVPDSWGRLPAYSLGCCRLVVQVDGMVRNPGVQATY